MSAFNVAALQTRAKGLFDGFTPGQRAVTVIAVVVALVGGIVFYLWAAKPAMAPVVRNLTPEQASQVTTKLQEMGVSYETDGTSTVLVPRESVDSVRIQLAGAGALPEGGGDGGIEGYKLIDNTSITSSDFQQHLNAKRATEGELAKAIQTIETVNRAKVHLALPENDVFADEQAQTKGSVIVTMKPTKALTAQNVEAIVNLVASSVPKLDPANVSVADSTGKLLNAPGQGAVGAAGSDAKMQLIQTYSAIYTRKINELLDKLVGPGNYSAHVTPELDFDNRQIKQRDIIPQDPKQKPTRSQTESEKYTGAGGNVVGGVLGPDNNYNSALYGRGTNSGGLGGDDNGGNNTATGPDNNYDKSKITQENPAGWRETVTNASTGAIRRLNYGVTINSTTAGALDPKVLENQINAALGLIPERGDNGVVTKLPFDTTSAEEAAKAAEEEAAAQRRDEMIELGKNALLGLLLLLALLIAWRRSRREDEEEEPAELEPMPELLALPAAPTPAEYALENAELPVIEAVPVDPQSEARMQAREEVGTLVDEDAEEVARLLRGWIGER